jgi:hypothetical protein
VGFKLKAIWLAALVAATYPLAMAAQLGFDALFGDSLLLAEWLHGSRRTAAFAVLDGWVGSIPWVAGFWAIAMGLRAASRGHDRAQLGALLAVTAGLLTVIVGFSVQVPLLLVLLLACAAALERCRPRTVNP